MVTGHGNIKAYLYRFKIKVSPMCSCKSSINFGQIFDFSFSKETRPATEEEETYLE